MIKKYILYIAFAVLGFLANEACHSYKIIPKNSNQQDKNYQKTENKNNEETRSNNGSNNNQNVSNNENYSKTTDVPEKAMDVLKYVTENKEAKAGYVGGRTFKNLEDLLPKTANGNRIRYQEWDVNPKQEHKNRGTERLVTGDDGSAYYTNNHYKSFKKIR